MKFIDINREFTAAANSYMAQGYYINAGTMGGSQGEVAHIDLTNSTEIIRVLLTTFNNYLGTEGVELIVGRVKDDIKPNQEDRWSTVWNERLEVISSKKFYRLNNRAQDGFYGTEEEANAAEEKRFDRYKSRRSNGIVGINPLPQLIQRHCKPVWCRGVVALSHQKGLPPQPLSTIISYTSDSIKKFLALGRMVL